MEEQKFKVIIVEDVKLELKGTEEIFRHEIPNAEVIGTAMTESEFWPLMEAQLPDLVLLDLGLGGSTTIGVDICKNIFKRYKGVRVLIFTGEILNEKLWVDVLNAGADGIILKTGELLTKTDVQAVMDGKKLVFNYPILEKIVDRFKKSVANDAKRQEAVISYDIDEYDERFLQQAIGGGIYLHHSGSRLKADQTVISCQPQKSFFVLHNLVYNIVRQSGRQIIIGKCLRIRLKTTKTSSLSSQPDLSVRVFKDT